MVETDSNSNRRVAEGQWADPTISDPVGEIIGLLSGSNNRQLVQEYGLWLARHEPVAAFTVNIHSITVPVPPPLEPSSSFGIISPSYSRHLALLP